MSYSDFELFILEGRVQIGDRVYGRGHYFFIPAGIAIGEMQSADGFEALVFYNDGQPTFVESDEHHPLAMKEAFVSVNAYMTHHGSAPRDATPVSPVVLRSNHCAWTR